MNELAADDRRKGKMSRTHMNVHPPLGLILTSSNLIPCYDLPCLAAPLFVFYPGFLFYDYSTMRIQNVLLLCRQGPRK